MPKTKPLPKSKFDLDLIFDDRHDFYTLVYDCTSAMILEGPDKATVDNKAVLIRAIRLNEKGERIWHYGENNPKWLLDFVEHNEDEILSRLQEKLNARSEQLIRQYEDS
jgi:hypothetical protein